MREEDRAEVEELLRKARDRVAALGDDCPARVDRDVREALRLLVIAATLAIRPPGDRDVAERGGLREGGAVAPDGTCLYATDLLRALAAAGMILEWKVEAEYGSSQASLSLRCLSCLRYGGFHGPECPKVKKG